MTNDLSLIKPTVRDIDLQISRLTFITAIGVASFMAECFQGILKIRTRDEL